MCGGFALSGSTGWFYQKSFRFDSTTTTGCLSQSLCLFKSLCNAGGASSITSLDVLLLRSRGGRRLMKGQRSRPRSPDEVVLVVVGADHVHAAGVDQGRDATLHAGAQDVLRSCRARTELFRCRRGNAREKQIRPSASGQFFIFIVFDIQTKKNNSLHPEFDLICRSSFKGHRSSETDAGTSEIPLMFLNWRNFGLNRALHRFQHPFHHRDGGNLTL